jgi:predicted secreted protein with PEFG-CTERM motif
VGDQNQLAPDTVLTSFVLDIDKAFAQATEMVMEGSFEGKIFKPGIEAGKGASGDGIVYLAPFHSLDSSVPSDVKAQLDELTQDILNKRIVVPELYEVADDSIAGAQFGDGNYGVIARSETAKVTSVTINPNESVMVEFDGAGEVQLTLPKSMIDGISMVKAGSSDVEFETVGSTDTDTTIKLTVPDGESSVEVTGATVVPEFGMIAALVLAASLVAVIGFARFRGNLGLGRL